MNRSQGASLNWMWLVFAAFFGLTLRVAAQSPAPKQAPLRIIAFGAHPDDAEFKVGGTAIKWVGQGHRVKVVSMTNGDLGHFVMSGGPLARRRTEEVHRAAKILGVTSQVVDIHDGELMPTLENRKLMSRLIREWQADIVLSHRPYDYNPDHRYVGVLAHDTAFMVSVPFFTPDTPATENNPVYLHYSDSFPKPYPFQPDIVVAIDDVFERKIDALDQLVSQVYETNYSPLGKERERAIRSVPKDPGARRAWLVEQHGRRYAAVANQYREALIRWYGPEKGKAVRYAEAFEICQYGRVPTEEEIKQLFPFFAD